jgi:hypothetical protein
MCTLERLFDYAVAAIQESKDLNTTTSNDLQAYLVSHEMRMSERSSDTIKAMELEVIALRKII